MASKGEGKKGLCALHSRPSMDNIREQSLVNLTDIFLKSDSSFQTLLLNTVCLSVLGRFY